MILDWKYSQQYPVLARVLHRSTFCSTFFLVFINDLPDDVVCNIAIYTDDTTLYSKCDLASDLWQQLGLASAFESDLRDTVDWARKWFADFNAGKTQKILFNPSNNTGAIDVKMYGPVLQEK